MNRLAGDTHLVIHSMKGQVNQTKRVEGELKGILRKIVDEALEKWNFEESDFSVIKDEYPITLKPPLKREQVDLYMKYDLRRDAGGSATFTVPVYIISFDNVVQEESYLDNQVYVITPAVDEMVEKEVTEYARAITEEPKEAPAGEDTAEDIEEES